MGKNERRDGFLKKLPLILFIGPLSVP
jgi:hypothetical protein